MDLGTIKNKMDAKDASGYQHVQEVYQDVRLVFSNAMKYNPEGSDVYVMSKTLSEKFEEKWKTLVEPKLHEEVDIFSGIVDHDLHFLMASTFFVASWDLKGFIAWLISLNILGDTFMWTSVIQLVIDISELSVPYVKSENFS